MTSSETFRRVEQACADLHHDGNPVTFTTVAALADVSRTTLYRDENLRAVVEEHRGRSHDPRTISGLTAEIGHLRSAVEALAERVRHHDDQLRRLNPRRKAN